MKFDYVAWSKMSGCSCNKGQLLNQIKNSFKWWISSALVFEFGAEIEQQPVEEAALSILDNIDTWRDKWDRNLIQNEQR